MPFVIETGAGVRGANSYINEAFVTTYLTDRNRVTENNWSTIGTAIQQAACIAATDYTEKRFGGRFRGTKEFTFDEEFATGSITFAGLPANDETFTLGDETFTFKTSAGSSNFEIQIGADADETATATAEAITDTGGRHASASAAAGVVVLTATANGASGDLTELSGTVTNVTFTAFSGGLDGGSQVLSFPRQYLYDRAGQLVKGIPLKLKQACAEYAVRSVSTDLISDPTIDDYAGSIKRRLEKVGPIEEEFEYVAGTHLSSLIKPYPAADKLISEYLLGYGNGGVYR